MERVYNESTICARATAPGNGAIAIVRLSGPRSQEILNTLFRSPSGEPFKVLEERRSYFGLIMRGREVIDEVLAISFISPRSYTGENMVEIYCHASEYVVGEIMHLLIDAGARSAQGGEFTKRAFLNGKLDLSQAEAVADLIASQTKAAHDTAVAQMRGGYSEQMRQMREELIRMVSLMELELDFSEEEVEFADRTELAELLHRIMTHIRSLVDSFALGNVIKNGIPVAIVGATNTGKSTLLNRLLKEERAIVSDIAGTTRDTIEETLNMGDVTFRFIDTAGIRNTQETIEIIGIERTYTTISKASIVCVVLDAARPENYSTTLQTVDTRLSSGQELLVILNKTDILPKGTASVDKETAAIKEILDRCRNIDKEGCKIIPISAKEGNGVENLCQELLSTRHAHPVESDAITVTNMRHYEALKTALDTLVRVEEGLNSHISTEFLSQDIRDALYHIGTITGEVTSDTILRNIFKNFCIGK